VFRVAQRFGPVFIVFGVDYVTLETLRRLITDPDPARDPPADVINSFNVRKR